MDATADSLQLRAVNRAELLEGALPHGLANSNPTLVRCSCSGFLRLEVVREKRM